MCRNCISTTWLEPEAGRYDNDRKRALEERDDGYGNDMNEDEVLRHKAGNTTAQSLYCSPSHTQVLCSVCTTLSSAVHPIPLLSAVHHPAQALVHPPAQALVHPPAQALCTPLLRRPAHNCSSTVFPPALALCTSLLNAVKPLIKRCASNC